MNTQYINLNMVPSGVLPVMHVSQFDIGRPLGVVVYDGSAEIDLDGYTVTVEATRTDGTAITTAVTTDGNIGAFVTTATMTNKEDLYPAQLVIVDGDSNRVASLPFMMRVIKAAMDENSEAIEEDAPLYQQYNAAIQALIVNVRAELNAEVTARQNAVAAEAAARAAADTTLQNNINTEAGTRATIDASLQSQINQLIAPTGTAPSAAEVENARISTDGITYDTLGNAIRNQVGYLKNALGENYTDSTWAVGGINTSTGASNTYDTRLKLTLPLETDYRYVSAGDPYYVDAGVWVNGTFVGMWNGSTCTIGQWFKHRTLDIKKLLSTMSPSMVILILQNATNTVIAQSDAVQKVFFYKPDWVTKSELNADVDIIDKELFEKTSLNWEQGGIKVDTGEFVWLSYRIRTSVTNAVSMIYAPVGITYSIFAFDGDEYIGTFNGTGFEKDHNWMTGKNSFADLRNYPTYTFWLVGGYVDNTSVQPSVGSLIEVYYRAQQESVLYFSATPNIIFQARNVDDTKFPPESKWYIQAAAKNQYDRVRCTVRKTTDGYYFMCHDDNINNVARNLDGSVISEPVSASGKTLAQLNQYDWGIKYGSQYAGATVPLLSEFLKYASIYNLGVTWHSATTDVETDASLAEQFDMIDKYGLTDNLIVITSNGHNLTTMEKIFARNPRISYYIGGAPEYFEDSSVVARIKGLQTAYNKIYVQLYPWGTTPSDSFISFAKSNNFVLYDSVTMDVSDLLNVNMFSKGYGLREVNNVYNVKSTVRNWADSLINS